MFRRKVRGYGFFLSQRRSLLTKTFKDLAPHTYVDSNFPHSTLTHAPVHAHLQLIPAHRSALTHTATKLTGTHLHPHHAHSTLTQLLLGAHILPHTMVTYSNAHTYTHGSTPAHPLHTFHSNARPHTHRCATNTLPNNSTHQHTSPNIHTPTRSQITRLRTNTTQPFYCQRKMDFEGTRMTLQEIGA